MLAAPLSGHALLEPERQFLEVHLEPLGDGSGLRRALFALAIVVAEAEELLAV